MKAQILTFVKGLVMDWVSGAQVSSKIVRNPVWKVLDKGEKKYFRN